MKIYKRITSFFMMIISLFLSTVLIYAANAYVLRVGVSNGKGAHAYSVPKLSRHETANTILGNEAIVAAY